LRSRPRALALAALIGVLAILAVALRGGESHTQAELALQRAHLALVSRQLLQVQDAMQREVSAARAAWPKLASGLPGRPSIGLATEAAEAAAAAQAIPTPAFVQERHELTGPAQRIATLFDDFLLLVQRGWDHTHQTIAALRGKSVPTASFERANAGLYIDSIYDGNFFVSLIGERVLHSYERLGGASSFGASLTPAEVESIVSAYSPGADRLTPHLWRALLAET
jgi:hypothetical protein